MFTLLKKIESNIGVMTFSTTVVLLIVGLGVYIKNSGGIGVELPFNVEFITWSGIVLLVLSTFRIFDNPSPRYQPLLLGGGVILLVPWLLQVKNNPGVWVLLAALLLWILLVRIRFTGASKRLVLHCVFTLAFVQAFLGAVQTFFPQIAFSLMEYDWLHNQGRPYGIFQQVNLLGSFLATGTGCGLLLLMTTQNRWAKWVFMGGLVFIIFILTINQSRAGEIGALAVILFLLVLKGQEVPVRSRITVSLMMAAAFVGWYVVNHVHVMIDGQAFRMAREYGESNSERWHIYQITWQMIMERPWFGWGYGRFEYAFSRWVLAHPEYNYQYSSIVTHPHNELLYTWFQGGVIALGGVLLLVFGWFRGLIQAWKSDKMLAGYAVLIVPLLIHTNLEYPFYQSVVHFTLFIVLLRLGGADKELTMAKNERSQSGMVIFSAVYGVILTAFGVTGLLTNYQLTALERGHLINFPSSLPWYFSSQPERAEFDSMVALLIDYNTTHNEQDLTDFTSRAEKWSERHNDKNIWNSRIMIAAHRGDVAQKEALLSMYSQLFPPQDAGQSEK